MLEFVAVLMNFFHARPRADMYNMQRRIRRFFRSCVHLGLSKMNRILRKSAPYELMLERRRAAARHIPSAMTFHLAPSRHMMACRRRR